MTSKKSLKRSLGLLIKQLNLINTFFFEGFVDKLLKKPRFDVFFF